MSNSKNLLDKRQLTKDLLHLTNRSASSFSSEIGVFRGSITQWLKHGGSSIGIEKQDELLKKLGVSGGTLSPDKVHNWTLKTGDLLPLARVLDWAGGRPYEMLFIFPSPVISFKELTNINYLTRPHLIRSSFPSIRISFRWRTPVFLLTTKIQEIDPVIVQTGLAKWRNIPKETPASYSFIKVERSLYDRFEEGEISIEDFEQVWNSVKTLDEDYVREGEPGQKNLFSWEDFIVWAEDSGISPGEARRRLEKHT